MNDSEESTNIKYLGIFLCNVCDNDTEEGCKQTFSILINKTMPTL